MKDKKFILATTLIATLPLLALALSRWQNEEFSHIPEKRMVIDGRDVKNGVIVRWPQKGVANIISPKFTIAFEGESWSGMSLIKAQYQVDGRYGGIFPPDSEPFHEDMGNGVKFEYSTQRRESLINYKNHRFIYCDFLNTLKADNKKYSTIQAPVYLLVTQQGDIKQLK